MLEKIPEIEEFLEDDDLSVEKHYTKFQIIKYFIKHFIYGYIASKI
jgi:hypothetical protein